MLERAIKYRLYPTGTQKVLLEKHFGATRWVFNYGLSKKIETYQKEKESLSCFEIANELPKLKEEIEWLKEINAQSLQMSLRQLDNAYTAFFRKQNDFPKFKSKKDKKSFSIPQGNRIDFESEKAFFIKIGKIKVKVDREFDAKIIRATISKNSIGQFFVSYIIKDVKEKKLKKIYEKNTLGIDLGIKDFATLSSGVRIENPKYLKVSENRLKVLQRRLSKKQKGSKNRIKARLKVAKCHNKIRNQRINFLHNLTTKLVRDNQTNTYAIENLNIKGMMKNHCLAKAISDVSWGEFVRQMDYKCKWSGKNLLKIGRFEPSSKMCSCGEINHKLTLADREWTCLKCGTTHDRDILAANNIKKFALTPKLIGVEPVKLTQ